MRILMTFANNTSTQSDQHLCCSLPIVLLLTSENDISRIIYSLFKGRQNIFLTLSSTKFVLKCATKILKIG